MEKVVLTIGESRPKTWKPLASLIMLVEGSDASHFFVSWRCTNLDVRKVGEARGSGGRLISNNEFKRTNRVVRGHQYEVSEETLFKVEKFLWENLKGYAYKQIIGILWMRIVGLLGIKISNPFRDGARSMVCTEVVLRVIEIIKGIDLPEEDFGIVETQKFNIKHRDNEISKDKLERINRKKQFPH